MSTGLVIALIAVVVAVIAAGAFVVPRVRSGSGGGLRRRFGPEYDRVLARHGGDRAAAEQELGDRVRRHGSLEQRPLSAGAREEYTARWTAVQQRFVDAPDEAVAEARALIARLAADRGFPADGPDGELTDALSVHHAHHVEGLRGLHAAAHGGSGTEDRREALLRARALFEALTESSRAVEARPEHAGGPASGHAAAHKPGRAARSRWHFGGGHPKGSAS
jgi:hypothetical protein